LEKDIKKTYKGNCSNITDVDLNELFNDFHTLLDYEVSENEIKNAVFAQSNSQSSGNDIIVSEIFKCSFE